MTTGDAVQCLKRLPAQDDEVRELAAVINKGFVGRSQEEIVASLCLLKYCAKLLRTDEIVELSIFAK